MRKAQEKNLYKLRLLSLSSSDFRFTKPFVSPQDALKSSLIAHENASLRHPPT